MSLLARVGGWLVDRIAPLDDPEPSYLDREDGVTGSTAHEPSITAQGVDEP